MEDTVELDSAATNGVVTLSVDQLIQLDKEDLVSKVISMQQHINQLKAIIRKQQNQSKSIKTSKKSVRPFDFARYKRRHIFLKFLYLGWNYDGFVVQEDTVKTVEAALFEALIRTKLVPDRETANYHRCGRTDKGVSAFTQVVSLTVRSTLQTGRGVFPYGEEWDGANHNNSSESPDADITGEIDYLSALNGVLPKDIRVIAWAPIPQGPSVSARFDCRHRCYQYYFPRGRLDIDRMNEACIHLVGEHDFRNLCKMDVNNGVVNYVRRVHSASVRPLRSETAATDSPYSMCVFTIDASAYLWHQIRCIMGVLLLVGDGREPPSVVQRLLSVHDNPCKPQYCLASDLPLVLFDAHYDCEQVPCWVYGRNEATLQSVVGQLHHEWAKHAVRATVVRQMIHSLTDTYAHHFAQTLTFDQVNYPLTVFLSGVQSKVYKPLFSRPFCDTLESRLQKQKAKKRIKLSND